MVEVKLHFKIEKNFGKSGILFYRVAVGRKHYYVDSSFRVSASEWDESRQMIVLPDNDFSRKNYLSLIIEDIRKCVNKLLINLEGLSSSDAENYLRQFTGDCLEGGKKDRRIFNFFHRKILYLEQLGRFRSSETFQSTLRSFQDFRSGLDLYFPFLDRDMVECYEAYMKRKGLSRNTTSFYIRILRSLYKDAVEEGLTRDCFPFRTVYTGIDRTKKRAVTIDEIRQIKTLDLTLWPFLDFSRDMFLFSFFTRGMSFVDMAYLRKKDLKSGYITYRRKKSGQLLVIAWTSQMQEIVNKYSSSTPYLLPIISRLDGTERTQYKKELIKMNRHLKIIGKLVGLKISLSTYVSRHSWASIAHSKNVPIGIISEGLGHSNEITTQIYLDSIDHSVVDNVNQMIIDELL